MINDLFSYNKFTQYFMEIQDWLHALEDEAQEFLSVGERVPYSLKKEIYRHNFILDILTQFGRERYNKNTNELYSDGWNFWFEEDGELREQRYGN